MIAFGFIFLGLALLAACIGFREEITARAAGAFQFLFFASLFLFLASMLYGLSHPV